LTKIKLNKYKYYFPTAHKHTTSQVQTQGVNPVEGHNRSLFRDLYKTRNFTV